MVEQPYQYQRRELAEPDWRRLPGWAAVTAAGVGVRAVAAGPLGEERAPAARRDGRRAVRGVLADLERDQREHATMSMLIPPQMLNTIAPAVAASDAAFSDAWYADPVRRYMLPVVSDRRPDWPSHPYADAGLAARGGDVGGRGARPTATRPRCSRSCCRPARSTAGTAPGWTWSATPPPSCDKHKFSGGARRPARGDARLPAVARRPCGTWWCPAATSPTCHGRGWRRSWRR